MRFGGPIGKGWVEDEVPKNARYRQWSFSGGTIVRREFPERYVATLHASGQKHYSGVGGGMIELDGDGEAQVWGNYSGILGADRGSGNRKNPVTIPQGKRQPPRLPREARFVTDIRALFILPEETESTLVADIPGLPLDPTPNDLARVVGDFPAEAYELLSAVVRGDSDALRRIADWVDIDEERRRGELPFSQDYADMLEAIRVASIEKDDAPPYVAVLAKFNEIVGSNRKQEDIREKLGRIGFGWLPASGRGPGRKKDGTK